MIQLSGAGKRFGHKLLFENTDWLITPRDRVGLVGANGTGKSTLMKVLAGLDTFDYGSLIVAKGNHCRISAAGWPLAFRPHRVCRMHGGVHRTARHGAGTGNPDCTKSPNSTTPARSMPTWPTAITAWSTNSAPATATRLKPKSDAS